MVQKNKKDWQWLNLSYSLCLPKIAFLTMKSSQ